MLCNAILTCCKLLHLSVVFITNFYIKLWYVTIRVVSVVCITPIPPAMSVTHRMHDPMWACVSCRYRRFATAIDSALSKDRVRLPPNTVRAVDTMAVLSRKQKARRMCIICTAGEQATGAAALVAGWGGALLQSAATCQRRRSTRTTACSWRPRRARRCGAASRAARRSPTAGTTSTRTRRSAACAHTALPPTAALTRCARTCASSTPRYCSNTKRPNAPTPCASCHRRHPTSTILHWKRTTDILIFYSCNLRTTFSMCI